MKYYVKQKVFSLRDKFKVLDESQNELYQVAGKFMSIQNKLELLNMDGSQVLNSKKQILSILPKYFIHTPHGDQVAEIARKFAFKPKFIVQVGHEELKVEGSILGHSFVIFNGDREVASIQKKIISWGDTYEINIEDETNKELYLFIVIIIDQVIHESKNHSRGFNN
jgi:uncharacterized protein YxjI